MALNSNKLETRYINRWLIEYVYHLSWSEFAKNGKISPRMLINGVLEQPVIPHARTREMVRMVELLCLLADGQQYDLYDKDETVLELAMGCIQEMGLEGILNAECLAWLLEEVQKQAVYVCCEKLDYAVAQKVYQRLWEDSVPENKEAQEVKKEMARLSNGNRRKLDGCIPPYKDFLKAVLKKLEPIHQRQKDPFLITAATEVAEYYDKTSNSSPPKIKVEPKVLRKLQKEYDLGEDLRLLQLHGAKKQQLDAKIFEIQKNRVKYLSELSEYTGYTDANAEDVENERPAVVMRKRTVKRLASTSHERGVDGNSPKRSRTSRVSPQKGKRETICEYDYRSSDEESSPTVSWVSAKTSPSKVTRLRKGRLYETERSPSLPNTSSLRRPWTEEEQNMLITAVRMYGVGNWAKMREEFDFGRRTNVNLKDKWRTLVKTGELERLGIIIDD